MRRGVCSVDENSNLRCVTEIYEIQRKNGIFSACDEEKKPVQVEDGQYVSMNMWGMPPRFLDMLETGISDFLNQVGRRYNEKRSICFQKSSISCCLRKQEFDRAGAYIKKNCFRLRVEKYLHMMEK